MFVYMYKLYTCVVAAYLSSYLSILCVYRITCLCIYMSIYTSIYAMARAGLCRAPA